MSWIRIALVIGLTAALAGCRCARMWGDLNAPYEWREIEDEMIEISTSDTLLPIVVGDDMDERWAAMLLAQTIEEMSGRKPVVYVERAGQSTPVTNGMFVGAVNANCGWACALTNESVEAFRVVASNGCVRFLGKADFAVFDWCERELQMRYYPGCGKCVELRKEIVVPAVDYADRPVFEHRKLGDAIRPWLRISRSGSTHRGGVAVHQPHRWMTNEMLKVSYPCIFENGETPMLCYGSPDTLDYYKYRIDRHIAGEEDSGGIVNTNRKVVTVCQWDAPIRCRCERCSELYDEDLGSSGNASPIIWGRFLKELSGWLKVAHPDYMISFLPYMNTCRVPRRGMRDEGWGMSFWGVEPLENCEAEVCTMPGVALLKNRWCKQREERIIRDWHEATGRKVLNWHYSCWPQEWTAAPYVFGHTIQEHYADMREEMCGSYICGGDDDPRMALSLYVWMRCLWNPDVDVEAIYDEFAYRVFGPAAEPMRRLIALQEAGWNRQWDTDDCSHHNIFKVSYPLEDVERMKALVKAADRLVLEAENPVAMVTVRWYASGFEEFVAESDALAARKGRRRIGLGEIHDMVAARSALQPTPWAGTTVATRREGKSLCLAVHCQEPAADRMDFTKLVNDAVWGNDCVIFTFADGEDVRTATVYMTGAMEQAWPGFSAQVKREDGGWRVEARVELTEQMLEEGVVRGNVTRWRVGDRRLAKKERVPGSRFEQSRLNTVYTNLNADPAAFVDFTVR